MVNIVAMGLLLFFFWVGLASPALVPPAYSLIWLENRLPRPYPVLQLTRLKDWSVTRNHQLKARDRKSAPRVFFRY